MIKEIADEMKALAKAEKEIILLKKVISDKLEKVKAEKGCSFKDGSKYYQIRARANSEGVKQNYICESDVPFGSWLRKNKGEAKAKAPRVQAAHAAPEAAQASA